MDAIRLEALISEDEIKGVLWACGGETAPDPDGLMFKFLKKILGNHILRCNGVYLIL